VLFRSAWTTEPVKAMHAAASLSLMRAAEQNKPLLNPMRPALDAETLATLQRVLERLIEVAPRALPVAELEARFAERTNGRSFASMLADAFVSDEILLHLHPPRLTEVAGERPLASPVARWQARRGVTVTNLEHEPMQIADAPPRALLALLDGRRDREALDAAVGTALELDDPGARRRRIEQYVRQFARLGLLIG